MRSTYARVLRVPGAWSLLAVGSVARIGMGMTPLALILATVDTGAGYGRAGLFVAAYGMAGAVSGPLVGRLVDRAGPRWVLVVTAMLHAAALVAVVVALPILGAAATVVACAVAGATYPPLTAVLRGSWAALGRDDPALGDLPAPALSLDAAMFELVFVLGPLLVAVLSAASWPHILDLFDTILGEPAADPDGLYGSKA